MPQRRPPSLEDEHGTYHFASIQIYGDTTHTFVNRDNYRGVFMPGFQPLESERYQSHRFLPAGLKAIDHIVGNVELGHMNEWVGFYEKVMGFSQLVHFDEKDISTEYTALMSKVVQGGETGASNFLSMNPQMVSAKARSRSIWSSMAVPASSISPSPPTTS